MLDAASRFPMTGKSASREHSEGSPAAPSNGAAPERRRYAAFSKITAVLVAAFGVVNLATAPDLTVFMAFIFASAAIYVFPRLEPDPLICFVVVHPSFMYVLTTSITATTKINFGLEGLQDKAVAFSIVQIYQSAIILAYLTYFLMFGRGKLATTGRISSPRKTMALAAVFFVLYASIAVLPGLDRLGSFSPLVLASSCYFLVSSVKVGSRQSLTFFIVVVLTAAIAAVGNARTPLFLALLIWFIFLLFGSRSLLRPKLIVGGLLGIFAINLITYSFISVRADRENLDNSEILTATLETAFSAEGLYNAIPFGQEPSVATDSSRASRYYSPFLRGGTDTEDNSVLGRLTLIAHMDIVTARVGFVSTINWPALQNSFTAALPSIGQEKNLLFADEVVWDLGLRDRRVVGYPLITPAGELFVMGGLSVLFFAAYGSFLLLLIELRILRNMVSYGYPYVATGIVVIFGVTTTGTALALFGVVVRNMPMLLVLIALVRPFVLSPRQPSAAT